MHPTPALVTTLSLLAALSLAAHAGPVATDDPALHADVEIDPTAYALDGNSLHVGLARGALRLDLGNFGLALPSALVDDGFAARFDGFGAKLQWFPRTPQRGLFVGADAAVGRVQIERRSTHVVAHDRQVGLGVHVGYRVDLPARLYVTPWIGVSYQAGASDVTLDGATYHARAISVFPAVHVGYRLR